MKKFSFIACTLLFILLLPFLNAHAEQFQIGNNIINYTIPAGYIKLDAEKNALENTALNSFVLRYKNLNMSLIAFFLTQESYANMELNIPFMDYLTIAYFDAVENVVCTQSDFDDFKAATLKDLSDAKDTQQSVEVEGIHVKTQAYAIVKNEPNRLSIAAVCEYEIDGKVQLSYSIVSYCNVAGKLLLINCNMPVIGHVDLDAAGVVSDNLLKELSLKGEPTTATERLSAITKILFSIVAGTALLMGIVVVLAQRLSAGNSKK